MPKTKKQPKKNKILNWLKPNSPAKGMLLFALAFAVIGGGYMTYKSFAATNSSIAFTPKELIDINTLAPAKLITETSGNKKATTVAYIGIVNPVGTGYAGLTSGNVYNSEFRANNMNKKIKACISIKAETGTGSISVLLSGPSRDGPPSDAGSLYQAPVSGVNYQILCTSPILLSYNCPINPSTCQYLGIKMYNPGKVPLHVALAYMQAL